MLFMVVDTSASRVVRITGGRPSSFMRRQSLLPRPAAGDYRATYRQRVVSLAKPQLSNKVTPEARHLR